MDNDIYNNDITDGSSFVATDDGAIIKVIGIGGGGGNAVNYMFKQKIPHINFVVVQHGPSGTQHVAGTQPVASWQRR